MVTAVLNLVLNSISYSSSRNTIFPMSSKSVPSISSKTVKTFSKRLSSSMKPWFIFNIQLEKLNVVSLILFYFVYICSSRSVEKFVTKVNQIK